MSRRDFLADAMRGMALAALAKPAWSAGPIRIGLTPVILADQAAFLTRWGRYLSERVGVEVEFVARESYQAILNQLFGGQVDAAWICGYPFVRYEHLLRLLSVPLYRGQPFYQAYLIRPAGGRVEVRAWADLAGRVLAYSDPLSNSGWLVAQMQLALAGVGPGQLKRAFFAHSHRNVAEAVAARLAHAGSIDGYVWETMHVQGFAAARQTEVVWKSEPYGFPPLVVHRGHEHPLTSTLQAALLRMSDDAEGRVLLSALNLTGFTTGDASLYQSIRALALRVPGSRVEG